ncbi:unnamed protein product [Lampetra fluviatilis]
MFQRLSGFLFPEEENPAPQSRRASSLTESDGDEGWIIIDLTGNGLKGPRTLEESWILPKRVGSPPAPLCPECSDDDEDFSFPDGRALAAEFSDGSSSQSEPSTPRGMEESWLLAPPPCFSAPGEGSSNRGLESSPLENLLIEHPSMSVYAAFRRRRPSGQPLHAPSSPRRAPRRSPASVAANAARSLLENARRLHRSTLVSLRSPRLQPSRRQLQRQNDARNRASFSGKHRGNVIKQPGFRSHKF